MGNASETSNSTASAAATATTPSFSGGAVDGPHAGDSEGEAPSDDDDDVGERARARVYLARLRPQLAAGAVFRVLDSVTGRSTKSGRRPAVIIGPVPALDGEPEIVLGKQVRVCTRTSLKPHHPHPQNEAEILQFAEAQPRLLFTKKGLLRGFNKDGFFEIDIRLPISIGSLDPDYFEGWLPRPYIDFILFKTVGKAAPNPYPPSAA